MNSHRQWSPNYVIAWFCWIFGVGIIALDLFVRDMDDIGHIGLGLIMVGKIFHDREMNWCLRHREQEAFDLGRDSGSVRSMRGT